MLVIQLLTEFCDGKNFPQNLGDTSSLSHSFHLAIEKSHDILNLNPLFEAWLFFSSLWKLL
jgi:hypothetical protein